MANPLLTKYGGLVGWQWVAVAGSAGGLLLYIKQKRAAAAAAASAQPSGQMLTGADLPQSQVLSPIILQQRGLPGPPGPPGPGPKPSPTPSPGPKKLKPVNAADFPTNVGALTPAGQGMLTFATITGPNGKYQGGNVSGGAPVYALVNTGFGPVWEQGKDFASLPAGTKVATLQQFRDYIGK